MAGRVRQPIDTKKLEEYIRKRVPEIETPLDVKQVLSLASMFTKQDDMFRLLKSA